MWVFHSVILFVGTRRRELWERRVKRGKGANEEERRRKKKEKRKKKKEKKGDKQN